MLQLLRLGLQLLEMLLHIMWRRFCLDFLDFLYLISENRAHLFEINMSPNITQHSLHCAPPIIHLAPKLLTNRFYWFLVFLAWWRSMYKSWPLHSNVYFLRKMTVIEKAQLGWANKREKTFEKMARWEWLLTVMACLLWTQSHGTVFFAPSAYSVLESSSEVWVAVNRTNTAGSSTVSYASRDISATAYGTMTSAAFSNIL